MHQTGLSFLRQEYQEGERLGVLDRFRIVSGFEFVPKSLTELLFKVSTSSESIHRAHSFWKEDDARRE